MRNIVLLCAAGMSTSMLMMKMRSVAEVQGYACQVEAYPLSRADKVCPEADVILLGPQVRYELDKIKVKFPNKPVEAINMTDYGMMRGDKVIGRVRELLGD